LIRSLVVFLMGAVMAVIALGASPEAVQADPVKIVGGGIATFDAFPRLVSYFGVEATLQDDGTTAGQFTCVVVDFGVALGTINSSTVNDDGTIKLDGTASVFFTDGTVAEDIALSVTVWEGGPKTGRFLFSIPILPDPGDYETVSIGGIQIQR
jgi:hypothetical protein